MVNASDILILVADHIEEDRRQLADILRSYGYHVLQAVDGEAAIKVLEEWKVDLVFLSQRIPPGDAFAIARHILAEDLNVGMILLTDSPTTDLLVEAGRYEIGHLLQKPVDPERLMEIVRRTLRSRGKVVQMQTKTVRQTYSPDELMDRVIALAAQNARARLGGPFAAIIADESGRVLGEGTNSVTSLLDPTAHAEVLAIRRATEKINNIRLDGCVIYCSSEPTMLGQALIIGTGIKRVYYGLSHEEIGSIRDGGESDIIREISKPLNRRTVSYEQIGHDKALEMYKSWEQQKVRVSD